MAQDSKRTVLQPLHDVKIHQDKELGRGRWLSLHEIAFTSPNGQEQRWECCRRIPQGQPSNGSGRHDFDAVDIIPVIKNAAGQATHIVLVVQYRPPVGCFAIEFPSGLVDPGESAEQAALRELLEETGFSSKISSSSVSGPTKERLKVVQKSAPVAYEPGLTGSCTCVVVVEIEMEEHELFGPNALDRPNQPDEDEWSLQVLTVDFTPGP
ncbi:hypothetical protein DFQ27_001331 [Actinomortierella ambigua]|uniref:Nudix hydrolase domain-containing protein n=1 Tax=Actinomortierella ambigua TaxID=1343610 RepID=A0A9P6QAT6_9FUNG|nr:hypothetical protein DFQ27_001331 [Actinomortierella ambigua]